MHYYTQILTALQQYQRLKKSWKAPWQLRLICLKFQHSFMFVKESYFFKCVTKIKDDRFSDKHLTYDTYLFQWRLTLQALRISGTGNILSILSKAIWGINARISQCNALLQDFNKLNRAVVSHMSIRDNITEDFSVEDSALNLWLHNVNQSSVNGNRSCFFWSMMILFTEAEKIQKWKEHILQHNPFKLLPK